MSKAKITSFLYGYNYWISPENQQEHSNMMVLSQIFTQCVPAMKIIKKHTLYILYMIVYHAWLYRLQLDYARPLAFQRK